MKIKYDIKVEDYQNIRELVSRNKLNDDQVKRAIDGSMINISVYEDYLSWYW